MISSSFHVLYMTSVLSGMALATPSSQIEAPHTKLLTDPSDHAGWGYSTGFDAGSSGFYGSGWIDMGFRLCFMVYLGGCRRFLHY